jgi:branched-chain amino acid transport system ATP-binding protein
MMLEVKNLSTGYGKKQVLFDVTFSICNNEVVLLTGGNGSGKSTILKCVFGLLHPWTKLTSIIYNGKNIIEENTSNLVKLGIVYIPQKNNYFESLTVHENLLVCGSIYKKEIVNARLKEIYMLPKLYESRNRTPFNLSGGERQLLALGNALMHKPSLILFDEPFAGLDKSNAKRMANELVRLKGQNVSMLIVEHRKTISEIIDKEIKIEFGKII